MACTHTCSARQIMVVSTRRKNRAQNRTTIVQVVAHHFEQVFRSKPLFTRDHVHTTWLLQTHGSSLPCICKCTRTWRARTWRVGDRLASPELGPENSPRTNFLHTHNDVKCRSSSLRRAELKCRARMSDSMPDEYAEGRHRRSCILARSKPLCYDTYHCCKHCNKQKQLRAAHDVKRLNG